MHNCVHTGVPVQLKYLRLVLDGGKCDVNGSQFYDTLYLISVDETVLIWIVLHLPGCCRFLCFVSVVAKFI